jgi:hypothetical protein
MSNIIDLTKRLKSNSNTLEKSEFYLRLLKCQENEKLYGKCECEVCKKKVEIANQLISTCTELLIELNKNGKDTWYFGDQLEIFTLCLLKVKEHCQKEFKEDE